MRVFITGGTGFIGSEVVKELLRSGHEIIGLARSDASAQKLRDVGATVLDGSLEDKDCLTRGAELADAVIHAAFIHNFADFGVAAEVDRQAIEALGEAMVGTNHPFVVTSGVPSGESGQIATEKTSAIQSGFARVSEKAALPFAERGVQVSIVRPSRFVYGEANHGFISRVIEIARQSGKSAYVGNGDNHIHAVHVLDVASLFRLVIEKGTTGAKYQAVGDSAIEFRDVAEIIGEQLEIPAVSISPEEAMSHFGFLGAIVAADNPASSEITQKVLGWLPTQQSLLTDLTDSFYYAS